MKDRLKELRKELRLTQQQFSDKIGISRNNIAGYETGKSIPGDAVISLICREFNVNGDWLRTGNGEMFKKTTREQEIASFTADLFMSEADSFKSRLILALASLEETEWEFLEEIANKIANKKTRFP